MSGVEAGQGVLDPELPDREGRGGELVPPLARLRAGGTEELLRVLGGWRDGGDAGAHLVGGGQLNRLEGGGPARTVRIEYQEQLVGEALEQPHLVVGQRGSRAGDGVGDPVVMSGDDVELPLHSYGVTFPGDVVARQV